MELAAFHLQSSRFADSRPPSFGAHPSIRSIRARRQRRTELTREELERQLDRLELAASVRTRFESLFRGKRKQENNPSPASVSQRSANSRLKSINSSTGQSTQQLAAKREVFASPPLFLEEGAHLLSLLSAVAMSTLRNDLEHAESPLATFEKGLPWPHVGESRWPQEWKLCHCFLTLYCV